MDPVGGMWGRAVYRGCRVSALTADEEEEEEEEDHHVRPPPDRTGPDRWQPPVMCVSLPRLLMQRKAEVASVVPSSTLCRCDLLLC